MHGVFMLNHVVPQLVVAAFTQSFYFGAFMQLLVNMMIFNVLLSPRPLPFDLLVEQNLIFVLAQMGGTLAGIALAQALGVPPILEVTLPWEVRHHRRGGRYAWGPATWVRSAVTVVLLTAFTGVTYDFGVSVWTPGDFVLWGLVSSAILVVVYAIAYGILSFDVDKNRHHHHHWQHPFASRKQLAHFLLLLGAVHLVFINVWWPFNTRFQRATELGWVMLALLAFAFAVAFFVYIARRRNFPLYGLDRLSWAQWPPPH